jgi:hypothetical protein
MDVTMVKNLVIQCPSCQKTSELFLSSNAAVIVLNCPHCWTPIISNRSGVFVLPERNINSIKATTNEVDLLKFLDSVAAPQEQALPVAEKSGQLHKYSHCHSLNTSNATAIQAREGVITQDDITNLRIHLETCRDSKDFIDRI